MASLKDLPCLIKNQKKHEAGVKTSASCDVDSVKRNYGVVVDGAAPVQLNTRGVLTAPADW